MYEQFKIVYSNIIKIETSKVIKYIFFFDV